MSVRPTSDSTTPLISVQRRSSPADTGSVAGAAIASTTGRLAAMGAATAAERAAAAGGAGARVAVLGATAPGMTVIPGGVTGGAGGATAGAGAHLGAGGVRAVAPRRRDADVVQHAVVTAYDEERFVRHRAGPLEHAVDEPRIAGAGDSNHVSDQNESDGEENDEGLHRAPPARRLRKKNARAFSAAESRWGRSRAGQRVLISPRVPRSSEKNSPYRRSAGWCTTVAHGARRHNGARRRGRRRHPRSHARDARAVRRQGARRRIGEKRP